MLILPWVSAILILGFVSVVIGVVFMPLAYIVGGANLILLAILNWIILFLSSFPFATKVFSAPPVFLSVFYYFGLIGITEHWRGRFKRKVSRQQIAIAFLVLLSLLVWNSALGGISADLKITVLDVGQGDAILIEAPRGEKILVDGGDRSMGDKVILPVLKKKGITRLDAVFLTHAHADHVAGLTEVLPKIKIGEIWDSGRPYGSYYYKNFLNLISRNKIKYKLARGGQVKILGGGIKMYLLAPFLPYFENINNDSIVFRLTYRDFSMLFTGDLEVEGEHRILSSFPPRALDSDVLKVGHHGSRTATGRDFLKAVNPQIAVISCGRKNKFRHPHRPTLDKLKKAGVKLYRTDQDGAVVIETDGKRLNITTLK